MDNDVDKFFFYLDEEYKKKPLIYRVYNSFFGKVKRFTSKYLGNNIQRVKNYYKTGTFFPDVDSFSFCDKASEYAIPRLKRMLEFNNSYSAAFKLTSVKNTESSTDDVTRWKLAVNDMIYFHEVIVHKDLYELSNENKKRYRRGKYYYFKYYEDLWD